MTVYAITDTKKGRTGIAPTIFKLPNLSYTVLYNTEIMNLLTRLIHCHAYHERSTASGRLQATFSGTAHNILIAPVKMTHLRKAAYVLTSVRKIAL